MVRAILCVDLNGNIGKDNDLLFHIKEDMQFFKQSTLNNIVVMGYNTWLSLGEKPLPNRKNIVLTDKEIGGVVTTDNLEKQLEVIDGIVTKDIYIIGGAYVYNYALANNLVDEILITIVPTVVEDADTRVNMELTKDFNKKEILKIFEYNEMKVTIESWKK